jgi:hypothetical protein
MILLKKFKKNVIKGKLDKSKLIYLMMKWIMKEK